MNGRQNIRNGLTPAGRILVYDFFLFVRISIHKKLTLMKLSLGAKIGLAIGLLGMIAGFAVPMAVAPQSMGMMTIMIPVFALTFGLIFFLVIKPAMRYSRLMKNGRAGQGRVVDVQETNMRINNRPQVKLTLEVQPDDGSSPFQAVTKALLPWSNPMAFVPGTVHDVRYDPNNTADVIVVDSTKRTQESFVKSMGDAFAALGGPDQALLTTGAAAQATIVDVEETGVEVNNRPQVNLVMEVRPADGTQAFFANAKVLIPWNNPMAYTAGTVLDVRYDPADTTRVAIAGHPKAYGAAPAAPAPSSMMTAPTAPMDEHMQQALLKINQMNQELLLTGTPATATILSVTPMGVNVNGNNPAVTLSLLVSPDAGQPFQAQAAGVIAQANVPKYRPGATVFVKYDLNNTTRVVVERAE